jgi:hypothetical protein
MAVLPDFHAATFEPGASIDNPYFPLERGTIRTYAGSKADPDTGETETESNDLFATFETAKVFGVDTTVIRDVVYKNGRLAEDTVDWYAQDTDGNLWYFGEIVINYEYDDAGNFTGTNNGGAWKAGVDGARPGWAMPAEPGFGPAYYLEYALGVAEDESLPVGLDETVTIDQGQYENVLKVVDSSVLNPDGVEFKYYAPGVGEIREEALLRDGSVDFTTDLQGIRTVAGGADGIEAAGAIRNFALGDLVEGQALAGVENAGGPEADDWTSGGREAVVTVLGGTTELHDALGAYTFNPANGRIDKGQILFDSTEDLSPGDSFEAGGRSGRGLGLFAIAGGDELGVDLSTFEGGGLKFRNILTGRKASIDDGLAPLVTDADNNPLPIQALHVLGNENGANFLNPAAGLHAVELRSDLIDDNDDHILLLGFEDGRVTGSNFDGDYNDLIVAVSEGPLPDELLAGLLQELGGTAGPDVLIA